MDRDRQTEGRRRMLGVVAALAGALAGAAAPVAQAQPQPQPDWPARPIRVIVPYAAGGVVDVMTRVVTESVSRALGQPIVVEARPGANANIGADAVANAKADGYTWLVSAPYLLNNPILESGLRWKPAQFVPVARYVVSPSYLVVPAESPARSLKDFVESARRTPGLLYAELGTGSTQSMAALMLMASAGIRLEPVMYKGAPPSVPDLIAGRLAMAILPSTVAIPQIRAGKLRALVNTSDKRSADFPDVPTIAEAGYPEVTVLSWYGFHMPQGTPSEIVRRVADATVAACDQADVRERLAGAGGERACLGSDAIVQFLDADRARWERVATALKLVAPK